MYANSIQRRDFFKVLGGTGLTVAASAFLSGCGQGSSTTGLSTTPVPPVLTKAASPFTVFTSKTAAGTYLNAPTYRAAFYLDQNTQDKAMMWGTHNSDGSLGQLTQVLVTPSGDATRQARYFFDMQGRPLEIQHTQTQLTYLFSWTSATEVVIKSFGAGGTELGAIKATASADNQDYTYDVLSVSSTEHLKSAYAAFLRPHSRTTRNVVSDALNKLASDLDDIRKGAPWLLKLLRDVGIGIGVGVGLALLGVVGTITIAGGTVIALGGAAFALAYGYDFVLYKVHDEVAPALQEVNAITVDSTAPPQQTTGQDNQPSDPCRSTNKSVRSSDACFID